MYSQRKNSYHRLFFKDYGPLALVKLKFKPGAVGP
jgi:hypothetical protein